MGARLRRARALRAKTHIHDWQEEERALLGQAGRCSLCRDAADIAAPWKGAQNRSPSSLLPTSTSSVPDTRWSNPTGRQRTGSLLMHLWWAESCSPRASTEAPLESYRAKELDRIQSRALR